MMNTNKKTPKLRFKGFTDDWEQRKLGDIATFSKGNGYSKSDLAPSGVPIILYGRLYTNYETTISNIDTFVELKDKSVISQGGEVIVPASGETAEDISRASVVKKQGIIIGGDLNVIKANHLLDPTFLALTISNGEQQKELSKRAQGKSVVHLNNSDLQEVNLTFPVLNEQKEISTLFEKMDNFITLHQRKLEKLKLNKSALLQKLFPQDGCTVPEIRFKGFTDDWEQRKFCDVMRFINGRAYKQDELLGAGKYKVLRVGNFYTNDSWYYSNLELDDKYYAMNGDLLYTWSATFGPHIWNGEKVIYHYHIWKLVLQNNIDKLFALQLLEVDKANIMSDKNGSTMVHITKQGMEKKQTILPMNLNEQKQIARFLSSMDKFINLHQRKLDRLMSIKKALLQQLFV